MHDNPAPLSQNVACAWDNGGSTKDGPGSVGALFVRGLADYQGSRLMSTIVPPPHDMQHVVAHSAGGAD